MTNKKSALFVLFVVPLFCEFGYSTAIPTVKIREIIAYEEKLISALANYIQEENEKENEIDEEIASFHAAAQEENLSFEPSAVDVFRLYRRVTEGWDAVLEKVLCDDCTKNNGTDDVERALYKCHRRTLWPRESDFTDAAMALVRLCRVYNLDVAEVMNGNLGNLSRVGLSLDDLLLIADVAGDNQFHFEAVQWLTAGIERAQLEEETPDRDVIRLYKEIAGAYFQANMRSQSVKYLQECHEMYPENKSIKRELHYYEQRAGELESVEETELSPRRLGRAISSCERLCRNEQAPPSRPLFCRVRATLTPFAQVREEILSWRPRIVLVHEVLNQEETGFFENVAPDTVEKTGKFTWSKEMPKKKTQPDDVIIRRSMSENIANITGLTTSRKPRAESLGLGENLKIIKYEYSKLDTYNDRHYASAFLAYPLVTWTYFLGDAEGGDIVFPDIKVRVPATRGNAVYWYNVKRNGDPETRTRHCRCPVLSGNPWVATVDISAGGNKFPQTCGLQSKATYSS